MSRNTPFAKVRKIEIFCSKDLLQCVQKYLVHKTCYSVSRNFWFTRLAAGCTEISGYRTYYRVYRNFWFTGFAAVCLEISGYKTHYVSRNTWFTEPSMWCPEIPDLHDLLLGVQRYLFNRTRYRLSQNIWFTGQFYRIN